MLPEGGAWPPDHLKEVFDRIASWSAWFEGSPDALAEIYGGLIGGYDRVSQSRLLNHPAQYRGGVVGAVARWFWGAPSPLGHRRAKLHVPLAADIAQTSADLVMANPPTITVDDVGTQDRLDELADDGMHTTLLEAAEICSAMGGVYLRVYWDRDARDCPWLSPIHPDAAVPQWRGDRLQGVTFWRILKQDKQRVIRHLEHHERGVQQGEGRTAANGTIEHGLYEGTPADLGHLIPLSQHPDTADYQVSEGEISATIDTGTPLLTACYIPNVRPNRLWRHNPTAAPLGRADISGTEPLMDALDEVMTSWMRDVRLAKARVIVPNSMMNSLGRGEGGLFDNEREIYSGLDMLQGAAGAPPITPIQFAIRVDEHERTTTSLVNQILRSAGYSTQTFGQSGDVAVTATEVVARERRSLTTRDRKIRYWRTALAEILQALLAVDAAQFGTGVKFDDKPDLEFGDGVTEDPQSIAQTLNLLQQAQAISTELKVKMQHPDWDDPAVQEEVSRIRDDNGLSVTNPDTFTGHPLPLPHNGQPDQQPGQVAVLDKGKPQPIPLPAGKPPGTPPYGG